MVGEGLLTNLVKELLARARPTLNPTAHLLGPSFPSGHTATAAAFWAAAALLLGRGRNQRAHALLAGGAVGIAVAVACSRVFLDVHWFSDVLGGTRARLGMVRGVLDRLRRAPAPLRCAGRDRRARGGHGGDRPFVGHVVIEPAEARPVAGVTALTWR